MTENDLRFIAQMVHELHHAICPACHRALPAERLHEFTCDEICHALWIESQVTFFGPTRIVTDATTGKRYSVPTRTILERGLKTADLPTFPEVDD